MLYKLSLAICLLAVAARAADPAIAGILERLAKLEEENARLREQVQALRTRIEPPSAEPIEERLSVQERRIEEQGQSKVESSERVPVRLTGMLLFNAYSAGRNSQPEDFPTLAANRQIPTQTRGTMRQTSIGLEVESPVDVFGAHATGSVMTDFYGDSEQYVVPRIRTASLDLQWASRGLRFGIEKPIVAPRNPQSLGQVVYPQLWGAGNLWLWEPQVRIEQAISSGPNELRVQAGLFQTNENRVFPTGELPSRPGWQTRWQFARSIGEDHRVEFAPGFHYSRTLVAGTSAPSQLVTADWLVAVSRWWELSGAFFHGRNAAPLGGLRQGVVIAGPGQARAVGTTGGWGQILLRPTQRMRVHLMAGEQDDRNRHLSQGQIGRNLSWVVNTMWQLSPNVVAGVEAQQIRTTYLGLGTRVLNRYDLALAYLF
ncbi:MAG TPA: hypothetical protein VES20_12755 [Bryobacteraceae bacterium]|nr:hypothetical protein [Bryobacteraceae bacterium]